MASTVKWSNEEWRRLQTSLFAVTGTTRIRLSELTPAQWDQVVRETRRSREDIDAALDAMQAIKEEALDICNLQHGGTLRPKLSSVNIRDVVEGKLRPLSEHIPRGNIKVNG